MTNRTYERSSFRDKSGTVFYEDNQVYRQVNKSYKKEYDFLMDSGLWYALEAHNLIIPHEEVDSIPKNEDVYKIIKPTKIPFISYPYEWSFSQLKDAGLVTLEIQKMALEYGMTLKDASAYNIQMVDGYVLIDTLSFEIYEEGQPWKAYKQFCQHFLAPLALMSHQDVRLNSLSRIFMDGIPLDLASKLLPFKTKTMLTLLTHIHAHAKWQKKHEDGQDVDLKKKKLSKRSLMGIIETLYSGIRKLNWTPKGTEWAEYYGKTNYSTESFERKKEIISRYIDSIKPTGVWDLGANTGIFSRIASEKGIPTIAFDIDPAAVEQNYLEYAQYEKNIFPLVLDLTNPSPDMGWANQERLSIFNRGPVDTIMALALIHHLAISNNVPIPRIVDFLASLCNNLIIEFVPKEDSQVRRLLSTREDVFDDYDEDNFVREFGKKFEIVESDKIPDTERTVYCMRNKIDRIKFDRFFEAHEKLKDEGAELSLSKLD